MYVRVKRRFRLTQSADFKRVRRLGRSYAHPLVVLIVHPNELEQVRVGVAAGRSVGKAVQRNRAKRLIRAAAMKLISQIPSGTDLIFLARSPISNASFADTLAALSSLLVRAHLNRLPDDN